MSNLNVLFRTEVGSNMWGMKRPDSDVDEMVVYQQDIKEILSGYAIERARPQKVTVKNGVEWDTQYMEIGHLINLLIKGNVNALWTVTTPVILQDSNVLEDLKYLVYGNGITKASYQSIRGIAHSQLLDSERRKTSPKMFPNKSLKTSLRSVVFGINMMNTGTLKFLPIQHEVTESEVKDAFLRFDDAYAQSKLPEKPDEALFRKFLYEVRIGKRE
jgi:predicted nucleotidyltransferase